MKTKTLPDNWQELLPVEGNYKTNQAFQDWAKKKDVFRSGYGYPYAVYYKGNPETTTEWIVVTDDGSYYKHGAQYMIWSNTRILAAWSGASLKKTVKAFLNEVAAPADPDYQT